MEPSEQIKTELIKIYQSTLDETISAHKDITADDTGCLLDNMKASSESLTNRWKNNKKTLRTATVYELIPEIPRKTLKLSLFMDALVNILDDLNDEPPAQGASNHIVAEFLRVTSSLHGLVSVKQNRLISRYLLKILRLANQERKMLQQMRTTTRIDELEDIAYECYKCRSIDMDIFYEIPLDLTDITPILEAGRILRSVDILLKDMSDKSYDLDHGIESPLTILSQRNPIGMKEKIPNLLSRLGKDADRIQVNKENPHSALLGKIKQAVKQRTHHIS